jgi:hypothetical protein
MVLIILSEDNGNILELKKIISEIDSLDKRSWKIIATNCQPVKELQKENIKCNFIDDYFFEEDHYFDYSQAIGISNQWFIDSAGSDVTMYCGISLGVVIQAWITRFFNDFLSIMRTVERILEEENPDEIWLCVSQSGENWSETDDTRNFVEVLYAVAKSNEITCKKRFLHEKSKKIKITKTAKTLLQECKSFFYSLFIRRLLFLVKYNFIGGKNRSKVNIMLPCPETLNYVGDTVVDKILDGKRRNVLVWRGETRRQRINLIDISPHLFCGMTQKSEEFSVKTEKQFHDFIETAEVGELKCALGFLGQIYRRKIKPLIENIISEIERLESCFRELRIQLVLSHTDITEKERAIISVAKRHKIASIVLQHGSAGEYNGFLPLVANKFAAWGKFTVNWLEKNGVSKSRLYMTGAANFDSYVQQLNEEKRNERIEWCKMRNYLLYVTVPSRGYSTGIQPSERQNRLLLNVILDAVETMPERTLVIKLRPRDVHIGFYKAEVERRRLKNVYLVDVTDNCKLLNACGAVLTTYSTMAIEALFFGKPVIQLLFPNKRNLMRKLYEQKILCDEDVLPLAKCGAALGVESPEELREAIFNIYKNEGLRQSIIDNGKIYLKQHCYEPDGKAALRVIKCIDQLLHEVS